ncbi:MAG: dihydroxyacetone kinase subunit L [Candidatus Atribacteria bacterium]|jgi:dihydroxyacetone kinase-like protein|nr:dihydroxyacetone kinase subunit L [Candidatus Atribacteria bacterium]
MLDEEYFSKVFVRFAKYISENKEYLTELDSAIGDGDHGINMDKGCKNALEKIENLKLATPSEFFRTISMAMLSSVGGASGPLYGTVFMKISATLSGKTNVTIEDLEEALQNALNAIKVLGKAEVGDKTMIDVWEPVVNKFKESLVNKNSLSEDLIKTAKESMERTIPLVARRGRASYLGERSANHQDPGATSSYLFFKALFEDLEVKD